MSDIGEEVSRLWDANPVRIFLSHNSTDKDRAKKLKECLSDWCIASFVAHEDIEPASDWIDQIKSALNSMDCLVALVTKDFQKSKWTNQEIWAHKNVV